MIKKINMDNYDRKEHYNHFMNVVPCSYSVTANLDITHFIKAVRIREAKLYPALIFALCKVINSEISLRHTLDIDGALGYYEICHPSYTIPNATENGFSGIWTESKNTFLEFFSAYIEDVNIYKQAITYAPKTNQPKNTFYVSCTPSLTFTSLSLNLYEGRKCLTPMFTIGKYFESNEKVLLPLSTCLHHAVCDGWHVSNLYIKLQEVLDDFDNWLII